MNRQLTVWDALSIDKSTPQTRFIEALQDGVVGEAWQYKMRKEYAEEESKYPYWEEYDLSIDKSIVREITYSEAKKVIEKYEWLGCMPVCVRVCYGLFFPHKSNGSWLLGGSRYLLKSMPRILVSGTSMIGQAR